MLGIGVRNDKIRNGYAFFLAYAVNEFVCASHLSRNLVVDEKGPRPVIQNFIGNAGNDAAAVVELGVQPKIEIVHHVLLIIVKTTKRFY